MLLSRCSGASGLGRKPAERLVRDIPAALLARLEIQAQSITVAACVDVDYVGSFRLAYSYLGQRHCVKGRKERKG